MDHWQFMYRQQAQLIGVLQAPTVNLPTFNGGPMKYLIFMGAFEENVKTLPDDTSHLAQLLLKHDRGSQVVECCSLMHQRPPDFKTQIWK